MKRVLLACGMGVATSTVVVSRLNDAMKERGLAGTYTTTQCKIAEVPTKADDYDFVIATTRVPDLNVPVINGVPLLTGVGAAKIWDEVAELIRKQ